MKMSLKDEFIGVLSEASTKVLPMCIGIVFWVIICYLLSLTDFSIAAKEIILITINGVIILPVVIYNLWLARQFAITEPVKGAVDKIVTVIAVLLFFAFYASVINYLISRGQQAKSAEVSSYDGTFGDFVYIDEKACLHKTRNCEALRKYKNNVVSSIYLNDYTENMPDRPRTCAICISDKDYVWLITKE